LDSAAPAKEGTMQMKAANAASCRRLICHAPFDVASTDS
jgi:hypothetical protein